MKREWTFGAAIAVILALVTVPLIWADDISNNIDGSVDAVAEVMPLTEGGANGSTTFYVVPRNDDGKPGCNLTGSTTLVVSVSSSNSSVATVSPSQITFGSCGDVHAVTVTPGSQGTATISVSQTSNNTGASFNLAPATFTVNVAPPPNSPPTVSVTGVTGGASYEIGSVPMAGCSVVDTEDGNSTFPATLSDISGPLAAYGLGEQMASCSYSDGGGLTASASLTYLIVDTIAPVITLVNRTPANGNGWNNGDVTVSWSCSDSGSGVVAASVSQTVSSEGANQSVTGTCEDRAGNTASDTVNGINIDLTAPTIAGSSSPDANDNGWNNTDVNVSWNCTDGLSGVASVSANVTLTDDGAGQSVPGTCTDNAGNAALATVSGINIDKTKPSVTLVGGPVDGANYYYSFVPAAPTCTASDALSGLDGDCVVSGYSAAVGSHTVAATATDLAGNTSTATRSYTVLAWTLSGFYNPVDMGANVWNTVKGGSTVPLKFEVFVDSIELTDTAIVSTVTKQVTCNAGPEDTIEVLATGGTSLRYDTTAGQFVFNWQTPKLPGKCYTVTVTTQDGSTITANFKLK